MKKVIINLIFIFVSITNAIAQVPAYLPTNGLVGWWPFNGNANDESGNGNNGTVNGANLISDRNGNTNKAYNFNGVPNRIELGSSFSPSTTIGTPNSSWSSSAWVNKNGNTTVLALSDYNSIAGNTNPGENDMTFAINLQVDQSTAYISFRSNGTDASASGGNISSNQWHHIAYTANNGILKLYVDGNFVSQTTYNPSLNFYEAPVYRVGSSMWNGNYGPSKGLIDDIGIWNRALTACEINQLYTSGTSTITALNTSSTICAGSTSTLTASGATSYTWMPGNFPGTSLTVAPLVTTIYTVTGTNAIGCTNTATVNVNVNALPVVTAARSASAVCAGNSVTLSGGGASTYVWSNGITNAVSFNPTINTTYTVTGTDANGCSKTATTSVIVNALPVVTAASSASAVCAGNSVTLSGGGASTYVWSNGVTNAISFVPTNNATYTLTGTDANGCSKTATTSVVVNALPIVTAASSASVVCAGGSVTLTGGGASGYVWSDGVTNAVSFIPTINTTYSVTGTDVNGCSKTATTSVVVNALPVVTAASSASVVCAGGSVTLTGGGASGYVWSDGVTNAVSFIPTTNKTYTVTGTDANGCSKTATTSVVVNALPIVTAASSASAVCAGNSVTLSGGGASTYVWSDGVTNAVSFVPTNNATYTVTGTDVNGCSKTATTSVVVNALPVVTAASSTSVVCAGGSVILTGGGASGYVWSDGVTNAVSFIPTTNTTYTVTGTDVNGCSKTATTSVVVNALPVVTAASSASVVCAGGSVILTGGGASGYVWSDGVTNAVSFIPTTNTTYTVTGTDANGCANTAITSVVVNALPIVTAASSASVVCAGGSVTLTGGGATGYVWSDGVTNAVSFIPTTNKTYTVTGTDANGCANTATTSVVVNALPTILVLATSQVYCTTDLAGTLSANPTGGVWSGIGVVGNSFDPSIAGFGLHNAVYSYTNANSCVNSASLIMTVNLCTGVNEIASDNLFTVYPNPASTEININVEASLIGTIYSMYDNLGQLVLKGKINSLNTIIELRNLSRGIYLLNIGLEMKQTIKILKE